MEGLHPVDIVLHAMNVVVLFILLRLILWRPIERVLRARAERIKGELDSAESTRSAAEALKREYEENIASVEEQGREILREAQTRAAEQTTAAMNTAREQAEMMLADARERVEQERRRAVDLARQDVAALASEMAARILHREVSAQDDVSAALDFFDEDKNR